MTLHLIKLSVSSESLAGLQAWQQQRLRALRRAEQTPELVHITRQMPKRTKELLAGGSIYWVIKGVTVARQRLLELRPLLREGVPHCGIVYAPELMRVLPRPHRPFQGWRYLEAKDAPPDLSGSEAVHMPEPLLRELATLGLV